MEEEKSKIFIQEANPQARSTALTKAICVIAVLLTKATKSFGTIKRVSQQVRESPEFQDRRIYQDDLVITKFQDEVETDITNDLYFSTNASRDAFTVLNFLNTNGFYPRNQSTTADGHPENCVLDSLEVEKGIVGVINCDLSVELYQFSSGMISLDYYGRIPRKDYGFSVGNCSNIAITFLPNISFLPCEDTGQQNLHIFEIQGANFSKIAKIEGMNLSALTGIFLHQEEGQLALVVAKKVQKTAPGRCFTSARTPPKKSTKNQ